MYRTDPFLIRTRIDQRVTSLTPQADAVKAFNGGVVVISHDFRLLSKVAEEIWVVDRGLKVWDGDIHSYKNSLKKKMGGK